VVSHQLARLRQTVQAEGFDTAELATLRAAGRRVERPSSTVEVPTTAVRRARPAALTAPGDPGELASLVAGAAPTVRFTAAARRAGRWPDHREA